MSVLSFKSCAFALLFSIFMSWCSPMYGKPQAPRADGRAPRNDKNVRMFLKSNAEGWDWVDKQCTPDETSDKCAQAAIKEVGEECTASAKFFRKSSTTWQWISFSMTVASAAFTAVGASESLKNAKVFSTLGGTTGLGAVGATATANASGDQAGLVVVSNAIQSFEKFVQTGGKDNKPADNELIYKSAPLYAAQCAAAASSTGK